MSRFRLTTTLSFGVVIFLGMVVGCLAFGDQLEDIAASGSPSKLDYYRLEASPMGPFQTEHYTKHLNARLRDLDVPSSPHAQSRALTPAEVNTYLNAVHRQLNTDSHVPSLLDIGRTPDKRKVHALFLKDVSNASPNVAILSSPNKWLSLDQTVQLHTFAKVDKLSDPDLHAALKDELNYSSVDSFARNALPKTSESEFSKLIGRLAH